MKVHKFEDHSACWAVFYDDNIANLSNYALCKRPGETNMLKRSIASKRSYYLILQGIVQNFIIENSIEVAQLSIALDNRRLIK